MQLQVIGNWAFGGACHTRAWPLVLFGLQVCVFKHLLSCVSWIDRERPCPFFAAYLLASRALLGPVVCLEESMRAA